MRLLHLRPSQMNLQLLSKSTEDRSIKEEIRKIRELMVSLDHSHPNYLRDLKKTLVKRPQGNNSKKKMISQMMKNLHLKTSARFQTIRFRMRYSSL